MRLIGNLSPTKVSAEMILKVGLAQILIKQVMVDNLWVLAKEEILVFLLHLCRRVELPLLSLAELRIGSIVLILIHNCPINILEVLEMLDTLIMKKESTQLM